MIGRCLRLPLSRPRFARPPSPRRGEGTLTSADCLYHPNTAMFCRAAITAVPFAFHTVIAWLE
jgi:hypothetical protein